MVVFGSRLCRFRSFFLKIRENIRRCILFVSFGNFLLDRVGFCSDFREIDSFYRNDRVRNRKRGSFLFQSILNLILRKCWAGKRLFLFHSYGLGSFFCIGIGKFRGDRHNRHCFCKGYFCIRLLRVRSIRLRILSHINNKNRFCLLRK